MNNLCEFGNQIIHTNWVVYRVCLLTHYLLYNQPSAQEWSKQHFVCTFERECTFDATIYFICTCNVLCNAGYYFCYLNKNFFIFFKCKKKLFLFYLLFLLFLLISYFNILHLLHWWFLWGERRGRSKRTKRDREDLHTYTCDD